MSPDSENFEKLSRLLSLKRHEQPPPGYFHNFSREVIVRIKAGEGSGAGAWTRAVWDAGWLQRLWAALEAKPVLAGAVGVACCALLLASVALFDNGDKNTIPWMVPQPMEASVGFTERSSHDSFFEPAALADFQLTNRFAGASAPGSLFPIQPVNFIRGN